MLFTVLTTSVPDNTASPSSTPVPPLLDPVNKATLASEFGIGNVTNVIQPPELFELKLNLKFLAVAPMLDMDGFTVSAYGDTLKVRVVYVDPKQVNTFRKVLRDNPVITYDPERSSEYCSTPYFTETSFEVTIQNPTIAKLNELKRVVQEFGALACPIKLIELHVALDFRHASLDRLIYLAMVLPRLVNPLGVDLTGAGTPRFFKMYDHDRGRAQHLRTSITQDQLRAERPGRVLPFTRYKNAGYGPFTTYFGSKWSDHIRVYLKVEDRGGEKLERADWFVRHERVFSEQSLEAMGITTIESLIGFEFKKLTRKFSYEVGRVPVGKAGLADRLRIDRLMRAGFFAVHESGAGVTHKRKRTPKLTLAHSVLNKRSSNAWNSYSFP